MRRMLAASRQVAGDEMGLFSWLRKETPPPRGRTLEEIAAALSATHTIGAAQHLSERQESRSFYIGHDNRLQTVRSFRIHVEFDNGEVHTYSVEMRGKR